MRIFVKGIKEGIEITSYDADIIREARKTRSRGKVISLSVGDIALDKITAILRDVSPIEYERAKNVGEMTTQELHSLLGDYERRQTAFLMDFLREENITNPEKLTEDERNAIYAASRRNVAQYLEIKFGAIVQQDGKYMRTRPAIAERVRAQKEALMELMKRRDYAANISAPSDPEPEPENNLLNFI